MSAALKEVVTAFLKDFGFSETPPKAESSPIKTVRISSPKHLRVKRIKASSRPQRLPEVPDLPVLNTSSPSRPIAGNLGGANEMVTMSRRPANAGDDVSMNTSFPSGRQEDVRSLQVLDVKHLRRSDQDTDTEKPEWLQKVLEEWQNPVFPPVQKPIRSVQAKPLPRLENFHSFSGLGLSQCRLEKEMLHWCDFVAQVDCKFLLFSHQGQRETTLLLVDQHAADERVRVEDFLRQHCQQYQRDEVERCQILPERKLLLSAREVDEARTQSAWLARWGFEVVIEQAAAERKNSAFGQLLVKTVPNLLADRLLVEDRTLQTVIRALLAHAEERETSGQSLRELSWTTTMKHIPEALLDLVNSKACRGEHVLNHHSMY